MTDGWIAIVGISALLFGFFLGQISSDDEMNFHCEKHGSYSSSKYVFSCIKK